MTKRKMTYNDLQEKFKDCKKVIRSRTSKKCREYNEQKKRDIQWFTATKRV